jgi:FMN phosphatase YigB (HAD superfamily)
LIISEEVGFSKPSTAIFEFALDNAGIEALEAVYVGDSWDRDVLPASRCGIRAVWLNRYDLVCPDKTITKEIKSYNGVDIREIFL